MPSDSTAVTTDPHDQAIEEELDRAIESLEGLGWALVERNDIFRARRVQELSDRLTRLLVGVTDGR